MACATPLELYPLVIDCRGYAEEHDVRVAVERGQLASAHLGEAADAPDHEYAHDRAEHEAGPGKRTGLRDGFSPCAFVFVVHAARPSRFRNVRTLSSISGGMSRISGPEAAYFFPMTFSDTYSRAFSRASSQS